MTKVFIDGKSGTTGLRLAERLENRRDLQLLTLPEDARRDPAARADMLNAADVAFLCLPDDAAVQAAGLVENGRTALIDTSTAHRVDPAWCYGMPELPGRRDQIRNSRRIANPGCHASGVIALLAPLLAAGLLPPEADLSITSLTGYSGGGRKMIADYEMVGRPLQMEGGRLYALSQHHKHMPEILANCPGLQKAPVFHPIVTPCYAGMLVIAGLHAGQLTGPAARVKEVYEDFYRGSRLIRFVPDLQEEGFVSSAALAGRDLMEISVSGSDTHLTLMARFDNLGKGASGAAIQNMNLILGLDEAEGLAL